MTQFIDVLKSLVPIVSTLSALGLVVKYVPIKLLASVKNEIIPFLNVLVAFFMAFGGGAATANAGVFGSIAHQIGFAGSAAASIFATVMARQVYEAFLRPIMEQLRVPNNEQLVGKA